MMTILDVYNYGHNVLLSGLEIFIYFSCSLCYHLFVPLPCLCLILIRNEKIIYFQNHDTLNLYVLNSL